ncbi:MAG: 3-keto-5-aminohexanoate cleavage protein [Anaerolineae bacterium]|nr:3-keto-5-aminohexanoate cleavage protein [Anaerolineae bacterium]
MAEKAVITAALSGSVTMKEHNPNVPYTPEEFVREAVRAEEAGAAVVHVHFRDPDTGLPTTEPAIMSDVVQGIRENTSLLLNLSTGVSLESTLEERKRPIVYHDPELASINPGTMNFCTVNHRDGSIIHDKTYYNPLEATLAFGTQMHDKGIKPEIECFALSHVHNALFFYEHYDFLVPPPHFSFVFGVMGGVRFNADIMSSYIHAIPPGSTWQGIGAGPFCFSVAMASAIFGGHIRVGLEDNIYVDPLTKTKSKGNWDQVERAVQIARLAGREPATPEEARQILSLPARADRTASSK